MSVAAATDSSYQKEVLYRKYAHGELSLDEVTKQVAKIVPDVPRWTAAQIAIIVFGAIGAALLPAYAVNRRDRA